MAVIGKRVIHPGGRASTAALLRRARITDSAAIEITRRHSARVTLPWRRGWDAVFDWDPGRPDERGRYFRWFSGGMTNIAWNAVERGRGGVPALVCENERGGRAVLTYAQLREQVSQAAALRGLGVGRGTGSGSTCRPARRRSS